MAGSTTYTSDGQNLRNTLAASYHDTCAIRDDRKLVCVDRGELWETGIVDAVQLSLAPHRLCAVDTAGRVFCMDHWQPAYQVTGFGESVVAVQVAEARASGPSQCAVTASGKVKCWGENEDGQLGDGTNTARSSPVTVKGVSGVMGLASGNTGTGDLYCGVRYTGGVRCWGDGAKTAVAVTNGDYVRNVTISYGHVCLWRRKESASSVHCAPQQQYNNFANYVKLPLYYPTGMAGSTPGGLCVADHGETSAWVCMDLYYGLTQTPRAGYMTTLPTNIKSLEFGSFDSSCSLRPNRSLSCMMHGSLTPPCDIATQGAGCHRDPTFYLDELGVPDPVLGAWYTIAGLKVLQPTQPSMFGRIVDLAPISITRNVITVAWTPPVASTDFLMRICDPEMVCTRLPEDPMVYQDGRRAASFGGLRPGTIYTVRIQGYNWGSQQGAPSVVTVRTPN